MLLIIGIIAFAAFTVFDYITSMSCKAKGVHEINPVFKDASGLFTPGRYVIANAIFLAVVLISHFTWLPDDQKGYTGIALLVVAAGHGIAAGFNYSKSK